MRVIIGILIATCTLGAYGQTFEYIFSGQLELEDISCNFLFSDEIDYERVSTLPVIVSLYGDTENIDESSVTGYGRSYTILAKLGVISVEGLGSYQMINAKVTSLQAGLIGFNWGATEEHLGRSIIFRGTSRLLDEEVSADSIYFDSSDSFMPEFTLDNERSYKVIGSNDLVYSSQHVTENSGVILEEQPIITTTNPCFGGEGEIIFNPNNEEQIPAVEFSETSSMQEGNSGKGGGGGIGTPFIMLLLLTLARRSKFITKSSKATPKSGAL
ncbi:hypothetical protein SAMN02745866_04255 [Alteromonadaceae bacterium Bs31]|nr:hypothetical protein SAMN02745866_04255 [Alteromonadaceae bacterium Bs31]